MDGDTKVSLYIKDVAMLMATVAANLVFPDSEEAHSYMVYMTYEDYIPAAIVAAEQLNELEESLELAEEVMTPANDTKH